MYNCAMLIQGTNNLRLDKNCLRLGSNEDSKERFMYEAYNRKTFMNSIALQPLVADQAFMPHMEAMYVPFQMRYGNLTCYKGLQSERPKC